VVIAAATAEAAVRPAAIRSTIEIDGEAAGRNLAMALGAVGEETACEHADGAGAEVSRQRHVGGRERGAHSRSSAPPRRNCRYRVERPSKVRKASA